MAMPPVRYRRLHFWSWEAALPLLLAPHLTTIRGGRDQPTLVGGANCAHAEHDHH